MYPYVAVAHYRGGSVVETQSRALHEAMPGESPVVLQLRRPGEAQPFAQIDASWTGYFVSPRVKADVVKVELNVEQKRRVVRLAHFIQCMAQIGTNGGSARITGQGIMWELLDEHNVPYRIGMLADVEDGTVVPVLLNADGAQVLPGFEEVCRDAD